MSAIFACGICCFILSIWGAVQLILMGIFYKLESTTLIEDVEPDHFEGEVSDLVATIKDNYASVARNCFIAGGIYIVLILLSLLCIYKGRVAAKKKAKLENLDDDLFCDPEPPPQKKKVAKITSNKKV